MIQFTAAQFLLGFSLLCAQNTGPTPSSEAAKELADKMVNAPAPTEQDRLAASAPPAVRKAALLAVVDRAYEASVRGEYARADALCALIYRVAARDNNVSVVAYAKNVQATGFEEYGEYREALALLDEGLSYFDQHPDDRGIVSAYQGKGNIYQHEGDFARALVNLNRAFNLAEQMKFREGIIPALNSIGEVYREQGLPERALEFYEKARALTADDSAWNMAFIFNNIGQAYEAMGDRARAIEFIGRSRAVAEKNKMRPRIATSLAVLAKINLDERHFDEAQKLYEQSLAISHELRDALSEGRALLGLAEVARRARKFEQGMTRAREAIDLFQKTGQLDWLVNALVSAGRSQRALKNDGEARKLFEQAIRTLETLRTRVAGTEVEAEAFFETRVAPYEEMISLLVAEKQPLEALQIAEQASARVLLEVMSRGGRELSRSVLSEAEAARERELDRHIADLNRQLNREYSVEHRDENRLTALGQELQAARATREHFDAQMATAHPKLKQSAPTQSLHSLEALAPLIRNKETALLKFAVTEDRCYLFVLREDSSGKVRLELATLDVPRAELETQTKTFRAALAERSLGWQKSARELYDSLLRPAEKLWSGTNQLIVVPGGPLWELPFQALVDTTNRPLIETFTISYAPSLSALLGEHGASTRARAPTLLVFANPAVAEKPPPLTEAHRSLVQTAWEPLPEMEKQAHALEQLYGADSTLSFIGADARKETAKRELPKAETIQLATHGVLNNRSPLYSYLLFSQRDLASGEDGLLEVWEVMRMQLHARLAVLCGCETARGRMGAGEGVVGLSWAFFLAGCPSTIVSQWKVDSASATPLMTVLHRELLAGTDKAEALRRAALELRKDKHYGHPFYWAPFVLIGDSR
jgi:CHAT domain-containing protein